MSASFREPKSNDGHSKSAVFACVWEKKVGLGRNDYMYMIIRIWTHAHSHMYTHTHTHAQKHTCIQTSTLSLIHTHTHFFRSLSLRRTHAADDKSSSRSVYCSVWQCVAVCCRVLQGIAGCYRVLQGAVGCCSVLQCLTIEALFNVDWSSRPPTESGNRQCREKRRWVVILMEIARNIYRR